MLVTFLIMLREGLEASLIVGIVASYLRQVGRADAMMSVWIGVAAAVLLCFALGVALDRLGREFPQQTHELFEAGVGFIAVCMLTTMLFWMRRAARSLRTTLHQSVDLALGQGGSLALAAMVFLAVAREGLESVFFLLATVQQDVGIEAPIGAVLGLLVAVALGCGLYFGSLRLDLRRFFRWTGVFIIFVAAGLLAGSLRALHEAGIWNGLQAIAVDLTEVLPADGVLGTLLGGVFGYHDLPTVGEVAIYFAYLVPALLLFLCGSARAPAAQPAESRP